MINSACSHSWSQTQIGVFQAHRRALAVLRQISVSYWYYPSSENSYETEEEISTEVFVVPPLIDDLLGWFSNFQKTEDLFLLKSGEIQEEDHVRLVESAISHVTLLNDRVILSSFSDVSSCFIGFWSLVGCIRSSGWLELERTKDLQNECDLLSPTGVWVRKCWWKAVRLGELTLHRLHRNEEAPRPRRFYMHNHR